MLRPARRMLSVLSVAPLGDRSQTTNLGCPTAREVGDSEEPPQGDEGTVRTQVGRLERGGRPGETESTTKPSSLERPLGFVRLRSVRGASRRICRGPLSIFTVCKRFESGVRAAHHRKADVADEAQRADRASRYGPISHRVSGIGSAPRLLGGFSMRTIAGCVLALSLVGCHSGPRWCMRDYDTRGPAQFDDRPVIESAPQPAAPPQAQPPKEGPSLTVPQPAQKERTPYESSSRTRPLFGGRQTSQARRSKSTSRTTQTARRTAAPAATTKSAVQDDSVKQLLADLEKTKREKAALETKLTEESAKQTQQRLELEARLALIQEQIRQQSALQQVIYQQQAAVITRPSHNYPGPTITPSMPTFSGQLQFPSAGDSNIAALPKKNPSTVLESLVMPVPQPHSSPQLPNSSAWNNSTPIWNPTTTTVQQQPDPWPYSPQRR